MTDIIERLRIESRREPHEPIWRDAIDEIEALRAEVERLRRGAHPAITHCDNCGCDWLDNGLNPVGCPYCKQPASVDEVKEPDLWRCTVCGRVGTVGRCCGEETRERANIRDLMRERLGEGEQQ